MKNLLFLTIGLLLSIQSFADDKPEFYSRTMTNELLSRFGGYVYDHFETDKGSYVYCIIIDRVYDYTIVSRTINRVIDEYYDVHIITPWHKDKDGDFLMKTETNDDYNIWFVYNPRLKSILILTR